MGKEVHLPRTPSPSKAQQKLPSKVPLVASQHDATPSTAACSLPAQVDAGLQEWWLTGDGDAGVDKDLWIPYQE